MLNSPSTPITINTKHFIVESIREELINHKYIDWLNDFQKNQFLEVRRKLQDAESICEYVNKLRKQPGCDLLSIISLNDRSHIGNVSITSEIDSPIGVYGILIADKSHPASLFAGAEVTIGVINYFFEIRNVEKLLEGVLKGNQIAIKLLHRLGFVLVKEKDTHLEYELTKINWNGKQRDKYLSFIQGS